MVKKAGIPRKSTVTLSKLATKRGKRKAEDSDDEIPETKKVKTSNSGAVTKKKPDLSKFKGLPLILLPEIFKYLSPEDLVNMCDASLIFWHALCRNSESYIWKTCRENEGIYEIPDGMNEYYWAKLLFSSRCMECGAGNVRLADFYLRRRICKECKRTKCLRGYYHKDLDFSSEAFSCSPVTHFTADGSKATHNKVFWRADVAEQHKNLIALKRNVELGKPGATRALEEYKASRRKLLRTIRAEFDDFTRYENRHLTNKREENEDLFQPRYAEIESRFVKLGYSSKDFPPKMKMHKLVRSKTKLTDRAWQSILETLEPEIQARRDSREQQEWAAAKTWRRATLDEAYATHKFKNVTPSLWRYLPRVHTLCMLPPFDELITCDIERELTPEDFAPALAQLDDTLASAYNETKNCLRNLLREDADPFHLELESTQEFQDLQLATFVFCCKHCAELIYGFDHVRRHSCAEIGYALTADRDRNGRRFDPKPFSKEFPFDCIVQEGAAQVVRMVIEVLGLDPKTATPAQMDEKDARLRCACSAGRGYKWFALVRHIVKQHKNEAKEGTLVKPEIVPDQCMPEIRREEAEADPRTLDSNSHFACIHCDEYMMSTYHWLVLHIQQKHGVQDPQIDVDFVDVSGTSVWNPYNAGVRYSPK